MIKPRDDNRCPYCGSEVFEGEAHLRGDAEAHVRDPVNGWKEQDWVNECSDCGGFCIYVTAEKLTYALVDAKDRHSEIWR